MFHKGKVHTIKLGSQPNFGRVQIRDGRKIRKVDDPEVGITINDFEPLEEQIIKLPNNDAIAGN